MIQYSASDGPPSLCDNRRLHRRLGGAKGAWQASIWRRFRRMQNRKQRRRNSQTVKRLAEDTPQLETLTQRTVSWARNSPIYLLGQQRMHTEKQLL